MSIEHNIMKTEFRIERNEFLEMSMFQSEIKPLPGLQQAELVKKL